MAWHLFLGPSYSRKTVPGSVRRLANLDSQRLNLRWMKYHWKILQVHLRTSSVFRGVGCVTASVPCARSVCVSAGCLPWRMTCGRSHGSQPPVGRAGYWWPEQVLNGLTALDYRLWQNWNESLSLADPKVCVLSKLIFLLDEGNEWGHFWSFSSGSCHIKGQKIYHKVLIVSLKWEFLYLSIKDLRGPC